MAKNQGNKSVGDSISTPLRPTEVALRTSVEQSENIPVDRSPLKCEPSVSVSVALSLKNVTLQKGMPGSCRRNLWISYFFDGTGNNMEADLSLFKHSCIARLFRAHMEADPITGIWPVYIPGLGTNFPAIGEEGAALGLVSGYGGDARLNFALQEFDRILARPLANATASTNSIAEVNIAIFGFSRGAALARAFSNNLMEKRCVLHDGKWKLKKGNLLVRFRFMGLFDTVASVGNPMSRNNTDYYNPAISDVEAMIAERHEDYPRTRPAELAFSRTGAPGADPAPGEHAGHDSWGAKMRIHETVEEVRHFIAAHETRNSFPVDSISFLVDGKFIKPPHFYESVYPGAHSDVGGGYAPGEGGRAPRPSQNFCLIPLRFMYEYAIQSGVPMIAEFKKRNLEDFNVDPALVRSYNYYMKVISHPATLGGLINRHQRLYFAWRFRVIRKKRVGDRNEANAVQSSTALFAKKKAEISPEVREAKKREILANATLSNLLAVRDMRAQGADVSDREDKSGGEASDQAINSARQEYEAARWNRVKAEAKESAIPDMAYFQRFLDLYDDQLMADVRAIQRIMRPYEGRAEKRRTREQLRPHYRALIEAWEDEFEYNRGLKDEEIIRFFENYIHNSLAGFAKDATLPSDPRAVFVGGDAKLRFAKLEDRFSDRGAHMV